ncbi:hypothetical protein [Eubacterium sp. AB3007]|uniref:hypothetical protein n=1 Tax=Eubacterium sp. AB3007 TaxID=1392487 RepID=UPI000484538E|nr:hypothetical protein [Eubacterium sp. AB3007]
MIKAELSYNPYLLETEIKFNGREPRINSLVEKYQNANLQDWVKEVPEIFYNEMNGYDFELEFSGPKLDCEEVVQAFEQAGVTKDQVEIFHKGELEGRHEKLDRIKNLLKWFSDNPNHNFNGIVFRESNEHLYHDAYPLKLLKSKNSLALSIDWERVSIEEINDVDELKKNDLKHIPIVVFIDGWNIFELQGITSFLKNRKDVSDNQVFFIFDKSLNADSLKRTLHDLGFVHLNIVDSIDDQSIQKYFQLYPETDFINSAIQVLRDAADIVQSRLQKENEQGKRSYSETMKRMDEIDNVIEKLKESDSRLLNRDNIDDPNVFQQKKNSLLDEISEWRKKKTKTTIEAEAVQLSRELSDEIKRVFKDYTTIVGEISNTRSAEIALSLRGLYDVAEYDEEFSPIDTFDDPGIKQSVPDIHQQLMQLNEVVQVKPKEQFFFFRSPGEDNDNGEIEMVTTYNIQEWREYARDVVETRMDSLIQDRTETLRGYDTLIAEQYHKHLVELIEQQTEEKESIAHQLTGEEKVIQNDNKWLAEFKEQLMAIERE